MMALVMGLVVLVTLKKFLYGYFLVAKLFTTGNYSKIFDMLK